MDEDTDANAYMDRNANKYISRYCNTYPNSNTNRTGNKRCKAISKSNQSDKRYRNKNKF